jgi:hypothetical protein
VIVEGAIGLSTGVPRRVSWPEISVEAGTGQGRSAALVALTLAQIAVIATSVYLHRTLAHRALRLHAVTDGCCRASADRQEATTSRSPGQAADRPPGIRRALISSCVDREHRRHIVTAQGYTLLQEF